MYILAKVLPGAGFPLHSVSQYPPCNRLFILLTPLLSLSVTCLSWVVLLCQSKGWLQCWIRPLLHLLQNKNKSPNIGILNLRPMLAREPRNCPSRALYIGPGDVVILTFEGGKRSWQDFERHGTTNLFCSMVVAGGKLRAKLRLRRIRSIGMVQMMQQIH